MDGMAAAWRVVMPARITPFAVTLLLLVACDIFGLEQGEGAQASAPATPEREQPAAREVVEAVQKTEGDTAAHGGFVDCLLRCDGAKMSRADKAKCRYECEDPVSSAPGAGSQPTAANDPDPVGSAVGCLKRCPPQDKHTGGCADACKDIAAASPVAPSAAVLDELATCVSTCQHDAHLSETNRATCELNCAETARVAGPARTGQPISNTQ